MKFLPVVIIGIAVVAAVFLIVNSRFQNDGVIQSTKEEAPASPEHFESKINSEGTVTVTVLPKVISESGLEFEITLDTHSGALDEDMVSVSALVDGAGKEYAPFAWEGDSLGGHHREGILKFGALAQKSEMIKLVIRGVGGISERVFVWQVLP